jgi:hypothetical protein
MDINILEEYIKRLGDVLNGGSLIISPSDAPIEEERKADLDQALDDRNFKDQDNICICLENQLEDNNGKKDISRISYNQRLKYFLDGSLRTKYLGEYIKGVNNFPIIASQVASSIVKREERDLYLEKLLNRLVFIFPHKETGLITDTLFDKLEKLNEDFSKKDSPFRIEFLKAKPERDVRYSMLGKARDVMHNLEYEAANKVKRDENNWLVIDGALRKEEFERLEYTIGLAKSFSRKPSFKLGNKILNIVEYLSSIKEGERTAVFKTQRGEGICFWYIRLRTYPPIEPLNGLVKVDYVHSSDEFTKEDIQLIDELSAEIYSLRDPSVYPHPRWPSFIYPIRFAEEYIHSVFINHEIIGYYGNKLAKMIQGG